VERVLVAVLISLISHLASEANAVFRICSAKQGNQKPHFSSENEKRNTWGDCRKETTRK
jgi:hypothetical protein